MISRLGLAISAIFRRTCPDPLVLAIGLTLLTVILAITIGRVEGDTAGARLVTLLDGWRGPDGLWKFLPFGMQMCLVLVTGHALAATRPIRAAIESLASLPRSTAEAAALVAVVAMVGALINWGLGLIVGAVAAREVGRALAARGARAHYPLLCAAGYMGLLVWHGGLSGSAPLSMTTLDGAAKVLPPEYVAQLETEGETCIALSETVGSMSNVVITGGLVIGAPILLAMMAPRRDEDCQPIGDFDVPAQPADERAAPESIPDRLDRSAIVAWTLAAMMLAGLGRYIYVTGIDRLDLNTVNVTMIALGLILHASPKAYMDAVTDGARGCAGIIIQFPLYGGIMALMVEADLIGLIAEGFLAIGNDTTIPVLSFLSAGLVNLFVPSGGGQWAIQGPIALETGLAAGIEPGKMVMAVAYGDQLTNMLQPFWALPLLGITGARARDIVGYTAIVMVGAAVWVALGLMVL